MTVELEAERMMKSSTGDRARGQSYRQSNADNRQALATRLLWICGAVGVLATATILLLFGISIWTAIGIVLLLACPAVVAWVLVVERKQRPPTPRSKT